MRILSRTVSFSLAAVYLTLATLGHALHDHGPAGHAGAGCCGEVCLPPEPVDDVACGCCFHEQVVAKDASSDALKVGSDQVHGERHDCIACLVLSHLKVGYSSAESDLSTERLTVRSTPAVERIVPATILLTHAPRGPPHAV